MKSPDGRREDEATTSRAPQKWQRAPTLLLEVRLSVVTGIATRSDCRVRAIYKVLGDFFPTHRDSVRHETSPGIRARRILVRRALFAAVGETPVFSRESWPMIRDRAATSACYFAQLKRRRIRDRLRFVVKINIASWQRGGTKARRSRHIHFSLRPSFAGRRPPLPSRVWRAKARACRRRTGGKRLRAQSASRELCNYCCTTRK